MLSFRRLGLRSFVCPVFLVALFAPLAPAGAPVPDASDDENPYVLGLAATYRDGHGHIARRVDHQLSFHWQEAVPDARLDPGRFEATWKGLLRVKAGGDYRFALFGAGEVELKVAGRVVVPRQALQTGWQDSPPVALTAEDHAIELSFWRTQKDARLMVLWSGPRFGPEPIPPRFLCHPREQSPGSDFERGKFLAQALRCSHCHPGDQPGPPAPALDQLSGHLSRSWLIRRLVHRDRAKAKEDAPANQTEPPSPDRMPDLGLGQAQAQLIAEWLLTPGHSDQETPLKSGDGKPPDPNKGERLFVTLGCLACHTWRNLGASGWFGGGDLTDIGDKRPPGFFERWLSEPASLNRDHRMPVFDVSPTERKELAQFLAQQKQREQKADDAEATGNRQAKGKALAEEFGCGRCHRLPEHNQSAPGQGPSAAPLGEGSEWRHGCTGTADPARHRPGYHLPERDTRALRTYLSGRRQQHADGQLLLAQANCLACHAREGAREAIPLLPPLLADKLTAVARAYPGLAVQIPRLSPPALNSVGDKLTDRALADVIARREQPHRPYLQVRMPRFPLNDQAVRALAHHLIAEDRIPTRGESRPPDAERPEIYRLAGGRLLSSDGFGCTSCHQVGKVVPTNAPVNALGPNLSGLGQRIRRQWFDRWVRDPARIVPRMEMPSVQLPVAGVLNDKIDVQLAAVWHVLNIPGFEPPPAGPIRTLRQSGNTATAEPLVLTDVLEIGKQALVKPFLIGLAHRHNIVVNLESGALTRWTVGDMAYQRTRGKAWYWGLAGATVLDTGLTNSDLVLQMNGREFLPESTGQFVTEADRWETEGASVRLHYRLLFEIPGSHGAAAKTVTLHMSRKFERLAADRLHSASGFAQEITAAGAPKGALARLQVLSPGAAARASLSSDGRVIHLGDRFSSRIILREPANAVFALDRTSLVLTPGAGQQVRAVLHYVSEVPVDRFPEPPRPSAVTAAKGEPVEVGPGLVGERLPLPPEIMPTGLAWRSNGRLVFTSLKGQLYEARDTNGDELEDQLTVCADGLPAPYGLCTGPGYTDVSAKYALLRVHDPDKSGSRIETIASGWGYTLDYHDWAIGLPRNQRGEYFLGIPCQQDRRSLPAARFRGNILKLVPRDPTADNPRRFAPEPISAGHRFPMGLALDRDEELFVTDNQGNYKPFNELNHVRSGTYFGFINTLDQGKPHPARAPSAIDIPHPWTRSVNGVCFLYTPEKRGASAEQNLFGPLEGHLIGCEYDTRRLIRMTLQKVGGTYQGAAYPFSVPPADLARGFLGPLVCAVSPRGDLYVGSIRDSGWGAGNNVGEIVRVRIQPHALPCGIAEVRAVHDGFELVFIRPVDRMLASRVDSYAIESYRREATPAYGGPDLDRRIEKVKSVTIAADGRQARLQLSEMRPGHVYEFRLRNLAPAGKEFHPAEAHFTLLVVPE